MVYYSYGTNVLVVVLVVVLVFNFNLIEFAVGDLLVFVHSELKCLHTQLRENM